MKSKVPHARAVTQPVSQKVYERSAKIQGIIFIEPADQVNKKSTIIEVKPNEKVLFHCYKRYKTFTYSFDAVFEQTEQIPLCDISNLNENAVNSINSGINYMLFCTGTAMTSEKERQRARERELDFVENLFYEQLTTVYEKMIKNGSFTWAMSIVAIDQDNIWDLVGERKSVEIREVISNKTPSTSDIYLVDCSESSPETPYQLLQLLKESQARKTKYFPKSHQALYCELQSKQKKEQRHKLLFINTAKSMDSLAQDKNWDSGSSLVLNKCLLGLLNKMENNKDSYMPFRDSRLTRMMKPFLMANSRVDAVGLVNAGDEETPFTTLSLVKNLSRVRVPIFKDIEHEEAKINPESVQQKQKTYELRSSQNQRQKIIQQIYSPQHTRKNSLPRPDPSTIESKLNLLEQVRKNAKQELEEQKKLSKIRLQLKVMKKKRDISLSRILSEQKAGELDKLEEEQYSFMMKKQKQAIEEAERIEKQRLEVIQKSISKVEKLKMLKQYYSIAKQNQKEELRQFEKNQQVMAKFYQQRLAEVQKNLKKSPKELLADPEEAKQHDSRSKRYQSNDKMEKQSLPTIPVKLSKRVVYIKDKVKKGRVEYQDFLSKNVSQYKSYVMASPDD